MDLTTLKRVFICEAPEESIRSLSRGGGPTRLSGGGSSLFKVSRREWMLLPTHMIAKNSKSRSDGEARRRVADDVRRRHEDLAEASAAFREGEGLGRPELDVPPGPARSIAVKIEN